MASSKQQPGSVITQNEIPTFDVSDLEKKSPEELDALLRQMDEFALKTKAAMNDYPEEKAPTKQSGPTKNSTQR